MTTRRRSHAFRPVHAELPVDSLTQHVLHRRQSFFIAFNSADTMLIQHVSASRLYELLLSAERLEPVAVQSLTATENILSLLV